MIYNDIYIIAIIVYILHYIIIYYHILPYITLYYHILHYIIIYYHFNNRKRIFNPLIAMYIQVETNIFSLTGLSIFPLNSLLNTEQFLIV